ncbi:MAG TPA: adenylyl-sulfate kinase, partial [Polyangiaceae bacterium]
EPYTESKRLPGLTHSEPQVTAEERSERLGQKGCSVWLTGLPATGKTAIAFALERRLFDTKRFAVVVDPEDGLSEGAQPNGSSPWQTPEIARRFADAGLIAIFAYASPLRSDREAIRSAVGPERFVEVHVATSLQRRRTRDARGVYGPGHEQPAEEAPAKPDVTVSLDEGDAGEAAHAIVDVLVKRGLLPSQYAL